MTTIKTLLGAVALIAASTVFAETCTLFPKGEESGPGVIGKRYAEASLGLIDVKHTSHNTYGTSLGANLPVVEGLDLNGGYSYSWFDQNPYSNRSHNFGGNAVLYKTIEDGIKPFITAGLGYTFFDENVSNSWVFASDRKNHHGENYANWNVGFGAEFPYKWVSVIPSVTYNDDFRGSKKSQQYFVYGAEVNSWITPKVAIYVSVNWYDRQHVADRTWGGGVGVRVRL